MRIPTSTYRLQFNASFTFRDAAALVPYLDALGVTDVYASSYLKAVEGSTHGYDVADPTRLNPELGSEEDFRVLTEAIRSRGMGHLLDIVPNHMGIARAQNPWWLDVLEHGPSSRFASFFDIDWHPLKRALENKVLLPILSDTYGACLEAQEIQVSYEDGRFVIEGAGQKLPVEPRSSVRLLEPRPEWIAEEPELESIVAALGRLPLPYDVRAESSAERARESARLRGRLRDLVNANGTLRRFIDETVRRFNGVRGEPRSFDDLDALLDEQIYRLAFWRVASEEINYRRFFDVNELAAIQVERPEVFDEVHRLVFELLRDRAITGLRIDHVDGLYDPAEYLNRWREWSMSHLGEPVYVVVEKVLGREETLPADWPVAGTTGYEFASTAAQLFVDARQERAMNETYHRFAGDRTSYDDLVYQKKKLIMQVTMASDVDVLGHQLDRFSERNRHFRDFTLSSLIAANREIIACFPVYRTYMSPSGETVSDRDRDYIEQAVSCAVQRNPAQNRLVFEFVRDLLLQRADYIPDEERNELRRFIRKFQQTTSPVTAKGIEDSTFYIYNRLVSLNEVGGAPDVFGVSTERVHDWMRDRRQQWPYALSATSTHDTKRGEDVRARINVLTEIPTEWRLAIGRWSRLNRRHRRTIEGAEAPDRNEEYFLYQTLVGALAFGEPDWPAFAERIEQYTIKALREAKRHSSWIGPNEAYEQAVTSFVRAILDPSKSGRFLKDFVPFQRRIAYYAIAGGLGQVVMKLAAPGVPDFYQGTELWDFNLVDPDNRRPVDYASRRTILDEIDRLAACDRLELARNLVRSAPDGRIKLHVMASGLRFRREHADLFNRGAYVPLEVAGAKSAHIFAFARRTESEEVVAIIPRLVASLVSNADTPPLGERIWGDTTIPLSTGTRVYRHLFTGQAASSTSGTLRVADALADFPVALLERL
jgi:(1->4)-alpha-D-glucan 1-alpha-D-glucosylmutase